MEKRKAIICVDDEEIILNALIVQVEDMVGSDYVVEVALGAEEAIEILEELEEQEIEPAVMISDYRMPGMNGDELLSNVHERYPSMLTILLTGQANLEGVQRAINEAGLYRFMSKPWSAQDLELTLQEAIKSFEMQNHLEDLIIQRTDELQCVTRELEQKNRELNQYVTMYKEYSLYSETDTDGKIIAISDSFLKITGYTREEVLGRTHAFLKDDNTPSKLYQELWQTITQKRNWKSEICIKTKSGDTLWMDAMIYPKCDEAGNIVAYAAARQNITNKKRVEQLSITCPLTLLHNRRHLDNMLPKEINRARRELHNLVFMMLDIDCFKLYNDTYGHQMGDTALVSVAGALKHYTNRGNDSAYRFGGEEFCIITSSMSREEALRYANRLCQAIEELHIPHKNNSVSEYVTVSIGLFVYDHYMNYSEKDIIQFADEALYKAKESGRNRVCMSDRA
jgi:diguanylate cyclase (GGDEF)-like protein/PAS domain S-box-containing protein